MPYGKSLTSRAVRPAYLKSLRLLGACTDIVVIEATNFCSYAAPIGQGYPDIGRGESVQTYECDYDKGTGLDTTHNRSRVNRSGSHETL